MKFKVRFALLPLLLALGACSRPAPATDGQAYFQGMGCVSCHRIGSEGGAYGPDLTFVGFRKNSAWLDQWLKNPHAWKANTVMPNFHFPEHVRKDLVVYLSEQKGQAYEKNGRPWNAPEFKDNPVHKGESIFNQAGCAACHGQKGRGGYPNNNVVGGLIPTLTNVSDGYTREELAAKIKKGVVPVPVDSSLAAPLIEMPPWGAVLSDDEIKAVIEYLFSLKKKEETR